MKSLKISTSLQIDFLPVVTAFVEQASLAFGLGRQEALRLTLASEEVFSYLCDILMEDKDLEITCTGGVYFVSAEFAFDRIELGLQAFNITAEISSEKEEDLKRMGLLIAARSVDRLSLDEAQGEKLILRLIKDKSYPAPEQMELPVIPAVTSYSTKTPTDDEIKMFSHLLTEQHKDCPFPPAFRYPGKLVDMVSSSVYRMAIATDARGFIAGGAVWRRMNEKIVEFFGPYLFNQKGNKEMARSLLDACLESIARTEIIGVFCRYPAEEFPREYFESIGSVVSYENGKSPVEFPSYFRLLHEDAGTHVYVPKALLSFIEPEYGRLALPRDVYVTDYTGEHRGDYSVFTSEFDREVGRVIIRSLWPGKDGRENILKHLAVLEKEQLLNIFFEVDLGITWQAYIVDSLVGCGFKPRIVVPYGGKSDLVIFQYTR
jgi:hypothetical protein